MQDWNNLFNHLLKRSSFKFEKVANILLFCTHVIVGFPLREEVAKTTIEQKNGILTTFLFLSRLYLFCIWSLSYSILVLAQEVYICLW